MCSPGPSEYLVAPLGVTELTEYLVVLCAHLGWAGEYLVAHLGVTELTEYLVVLCAHLGLASTWRLPWASRS